MLKTILVNWLVPVIVIVFVLMAAAFFTPGWASLAGKVILVLILLVSTIPVVRNQTKAYKEKRSNRAEMARNILFEIMGILLAMILAALLGRYLVGLVTTQISDGLTKLAVGIMVGLLVGLGVGYVVHQTWGRLARSGAGAQHEHWQR